MPDVTVSNGRVTKARPASQARERASTKAAAISMKPRFAASLMAP
jgi:hypothetical protein